MRKKVLTAILLICVVMVMTACGGNADTTEVVGTTAAEESAEADTQAEAEAEAKVQEEAEEQARLEEADECYEAGRKSLYGLDGAQIDIEDAYANFIKAQELGNADANFYLGVLADWYGYPEQDYEQARAYYEQCSDNPYAQIALGFLYYNYQVIELNEDPWEKGEALFQAAIDQGVVEGYLGLAAVARDEQDYEAAIEYYQKVAEEGTEQLYVVSAMKSIGDMYRYYEYGDGMEQDGAKAIEWYTKAADLGDSEAIFHIGDMYRYGGGVEQDSVKAIEWYTKAADAGNSNAMYYVGVMYRDGDGVAQDYGVAMEWFQRAADLDNTYAITCIAHMYRHGNGVAQDGNAAIEWYQKAADLDSPDALVYIGDMYRYGDGVARDADTAIKWYQKSADLGNAYALSQIGDMYRYGDEVEQNIDAALEWYAKSLSLEPNVFVFESIIDILHGEDAALEYFEKLGDTETMVAIGYMYCHTHGISEKMQLPDEAAAMKWYQKAADLGNEEAQAYVESVQGQ